jgi:hypothetical protein
MERDLERDSHYVLKSVIGYLGRSSYIGHAFADGTGEPFE